MYSFALSDGTRWWLDAGDAAAAPILDGLAAAMLLARVSPSFTLEDSSYLIRVFGAPPAIQPSCISCILPEAKTPEEIPFVYYTAISLALARGIQREGGVLLHGALAEYRRNGSTGQGVIFSAPGGTGKSTASRRLPMPWRSWSDDAVLIVPTASGEYRAHPWPTWSRFLWDDRSGGVWDVQASIPLRACIFLKQASQDTLEAIGAGQAASLLAESARQINFWDYHLTPEEQRSLRLQRFDVVCALAKAIPAHLLHISLTGEFWREIERELR